MKSQWANLALLAGGASADHTYLMEAMRGERVVSGMFPTDTSPAWVPSFKDESPPHKAERVTRENWAISCSSGESTCENLIDGKTTTSWASDSSQGIHYVEIDLKESLNVGAVVVLPSPDIKGEDGLILEHEVFLSDDGHSWNQPVALGMWPNTNRQRMSAFEPTKARYVQLVAKKSDDQSSHWIGISELNVYASSRIIERDASKGKWGPTIDLPVVAATAAQQANGKVVLWSSWDDDQFHSTPGGKTAMTHWDPVTGLVTKRVVTDTQHDMFCTGISIDGTGMMVVTGGNDAAQTSLYDARTNTWRAADQMKLERGYQASTTLSDGRVFVIGGSWAGGSNIPKNGEVYDPATESWTTLAGCKVGPMLTNDMEGPWRADNHGWLFGWKNNTVFQGGPSVAMNWFTVEGEGSVVAAGDRLEDEDSMSGNAVMFDAVAGKILTFGGSPDYDKSWAHENAHIITLGDALQEPDVKTAGDGGEMHRARVFHTSVVLPDGKVFIAGGQEYGVAFNEEKVHFVPELYDPELDEFIELQENNMIRVYHSVSILAPDGRVLNGGGGLCGNCSANHYDAQVYTPPYLLEEDGSLRERPVIGDEFPEELVVGDGFQFNATEGVAAASLLRICTTTHTVNTDQRRVPLTVQDRDGYYETRLPTDPGVLIPGYWMMFVMDARGTPSVAKTIFIKTKEAGGAADQVVEHAELPSGSEEEEEESDYFHEGLGLELI